VAVVIAYGHPDTAPCAGFIIARSTSGLQLTSPRPAGVDHVLEVRAALAPASSPWVPVRVLHCQLLGQGVWALGCQFVRTPRGGALVLFG
jgi:hypothetical protein